MAISLELVDTLSGNLVGSYLSLEDALAIVRASYAEHGKPGIRDLALLLIREDGTQTLVAEDLDLVRLALGRDMATLTS